METKDYNIYAGLGGSFGGAEYQGTLRNTSEEEASDYSYELASEIFESYEGLHGLCDWEDFIEESPDGTEEEFDEFRQEQLESWAEYYIVPTEEDDNIDESEIEYLN